MYKIVYTNYSFEYVPGRQCDGRGQGGLQRKEVDGVCRRGGGQLVEAVGENEERLRVPADDRMSVAVRVEGEGAVVEDRGERHDGLSVELSGVRVEEGEQLLL